MDKRLHIVKSANQDFKNRPADEIWEYNNSSNSKTRISTWETTISMAGVETPIRYIKFLKKVTNLITTESKYSQVCIITTSQIVSLQTLFRIIKARWMIENNVFRQLKTQWHMGHCFIHHENGLEATLLFMIIAFNLMQLFFFRRLKNFRVKGLLQVEVIERIIKEINKFPKIYLPLYLFLLTVTKIYNGIFSYSLTIQSCR